jgi:glycosyltransferase involved in cell wall biosynthesis
VPFVLRALREVVDEVVLVDGHSTDDTVQVAIEECPDVVVVTQTGNGKGNALACGFAAASGDILVMLDADGSMSPGEVPALVECLTTESCDFVKASRFLGESGSDDLTPVRRIGNHLLRIMVNWLFSARYTDLCYGLSAFWKDCLPELGFDGYGPVGGREDCLGSGFEVETLLNIRAAVAGLAVTEVPSFERCRVSGMSNLRVVRDGLRIARTILAERRRHPDGRGLGVPWLEERLLEPADPSMATV